MADLTKMFVSYAGTVAEFKSAGLETKYDKSIVFIKGGANGEGEAIYTHGKYYGNVKDALAALTQTVNDLKYFTSISDGSTTASASGKNGVITFNAADPTQVKVDVDSTGVTIGLTDTFKNSVSNNTTNINNLSTAVGQAGDAANAKGSAFARIQKLAEDINAMTGGNGSIAEQIATALDKLDAEIVNPDGNYVASVEQTDGKVKVTKGTFNFDEKGTAAGLIAALDAEEEGTGASVGVKVKVTEVDGKITAVTVDDIKVKEYADGLIAEGSAFEQRVAAIENVIGGEDADAAINKVSEIITFLGGIEEGTVAKDTFDAVVANGTAISNLQKNTVNGKKISENPVLTGADVALAGYAKGDSVADIAASDSVNAAIAKLENRVVAAQAAADGGVQSVGGAAGAITLRGSQANNGDVNLAMNGNELQASIVGLGSAAFTASTAYDAAGAAAAVLGTDADAATAATVYGAKAYADLLFVWEEL